jgi:hypothetical protein
LWRFFALQQARQPLRVAWQAWGNMLTGVVSPHFYLAHGWRFTGSSETWIPVVATFVVAALPAAAVWAWRNGQHFESGLAALSFVVSVIGLWSMTHIDRDIGDHQIFWLSAVGVLNLALAASFVVSGIASARVRSSVSLATACTLVLITATAALGTRQLIRAERRAQIPDSDELAVHSLADQTLATMQTLGIAKPLLRLDSDNWGVGAGVFVQLVKAHHAIAVDRTLTLFDRPWLATGDEDAVLTVCGPSLHAQLMTRPGDFVAAQAGSAFVDGITIASSR